MKKALILSILLSAALAAAAPRDDVKRQMELRPTDYWPRGTGHVVLAFPGSREAGYHEPGGSFSPGIGSFGVSIWILEEGKLSTGAPGLVFKATSDTIPLADVRQRLVWEPGRVLPAIASDTGDYESVWSHPETGSWVLKLRWKNPRTFPMVTVRGVGPAGGPVTQLIWESNRLRINNRWWMSVSPAPKDVLMGDERHTRWTTEGSSFPSRVRSGWAYARLDLSNAREIEVRIQDDTPPHRFPPAVASTRAAVSADLPDARFVDSLHAQAAHLSMGVLDWQLRAGDPLNYPYPWLRDGAYVVTALARAGQLPAARKLAAYLAEHDFFGGFGPEADAPGLALWALEETAVRLKDGKFDSWLWPHVRRKADLILEMISAKRAVHRPVEAPVAPRHAARPDLTLVAEPARDGLINGRMDHHRPLLFINAVSYRGLLSGARLAGRRGRTADARRWRSAAAQLRRAWEAALSRPGMQNQRTWISGLWPSGIAGGMRERFALGLDESGAGRPPAAGAALPPWTYFELAAAHQWLLLGRPERVWETLGWFFDNQASPGLYTWWEGEGEENSFGFWEQVRGWVSPPHVTPHYWTAAEMLLLQLDMLAVEDGEASVTIGAGIPASWLEKPLSVRGLLLESGPLDWSWDGKQLSVKTPDPRLKMKAGPAFPAGTPVIIQ